MQCLERRALSGCHTWTSALIAIRRRPDRPERARNPKEEGGEQVYCSSHSSRKSKPEFGISVQFQLEKNEEGDFEQCVC